MGFFYEWVDFVTYPQGPNKIWTLKERLNCKDAVREESERYNPENIEKYGFVITKNQIVFEKDDEFEVTEITDSGRVIIWTKKRVWTLQHQGIREKLIFLPRHPKYSHFEEARQVN